MIRFLPSLLCMISVRSDAMASLGLARIYHPLPFSEVLPTGDSGSALVPIHSLSRSTRLYITALLCAPLALPMNMLFFLPMITGFWLHSDRLFVSSSLPSSRNVYNCSLFVLAYCIALYSSLFSDT